MLVACTILGKGIDNDIVNPLVQLWLIENFDSKFAITLELGVYLHSTKHNTKSPKFCKPISWFRLSVIGGLLLRMIEILDVLCTHMIKNYCF